jgi:hypothetical protein
MGWSVRVLCLYSGKTPPNGEYPKGAVMAIPTIPDPRQVTIKDGPALWRIILSTFEKEKYPTVEFTLKTQWVHVDKNQEVKEEFYVTKERLEIMEVRVGGQSSNTFGFLLRVPGRGRSDKHFLPAYTLIEIENYSPTARVGSGLVKKRQ